MTNYIATFYTHHDALTFFNYTKKHEIKSKMMPTPRKISASCGACVQYSTDLEIDFRKHEIDTIYTMAEAYTQIWTNETT